MRAISIQNEKLNIGGIYKFHRFVPALKIAFIFFKVKQDVSELDTSVFVQILRHNAADNDRTFCRAQLSVFV